MKKGVKTGFSFGLTSGIITTLGLVVGLQAGTNSRLAVLGGILTIAVADAFSDALGMHVSQESNSANSSKGIWPSTLSTFISKLAFALTFIVPVLLFPLMLAVIISIIWGISLLAIFSYSIAKARGKSPWEAVAEHITIGIIVIIANYLLGSWIGKTFPS